MTYPPHLLTHAISIPNPGDPGREIHVFRYEYAITSITVTKKIALEIGGPGQWRRA